MEWLWMILGKYHMFLSIHTEDVWLVPLIFFTWRIYLDWTQSSSFFYPTQISISSLCTSSYKMLWQLYKYLLQRKVYWWWWEWYFPKKKFRNIYNEKYQDKYGNRSYIVSAPYIKYTRIWRLYSGRKRKATGFFYIQGSPYCDTERSSHLRWCLHDAIINAAPITGQRIENIGIL